MKTIEEALKLICAEAKSFGTEEISINDALDRILAEDILADRDYPPFDRATMDGYAVIADDLRTSKELKLTGTVHAGDDSSQEITAGSCIKIMTGAPVPEGADAVIRFEDTEEKNSIVHFHVDKILSNQNIAKQGEDANKGAIILTKNKKLNATCISLLSVVSKSTVKVYKLPQVVVVSTGNEIVSLDEKILSHQIRDSNAYSLKSFLKNYSIATESVLVKDDKKKLTETLHKYLQADILILSGGVSKGEADYVPEVLISLGVQEIFHRVQIKPGNPLWFGRLPNGGVVFGLPGNPVSVQVGYKVFIETYLRKCFELEKIEPLYFPLFSDKAKKSKFTEYFPCTLINKNGKSGILPKKINTSGDIAATAGSDGIAVHPSTIDLLKENTVIKFYYWPC